MENLIGTVNAGYEIVEQGDKAVLAKNGRGDYAAWSYHFEKGEPSFYWGRYGSAEYAAQCFRKKERGEYSGSM